MFQFGWPDELFERAVDDVNTEGIECVWLEFGDGIVVDGGVLRVVGEVVVSVGV